MSAKLYSRQKALKGADLSFDREITIGRGRQNTVVLDQKEISKKHLRIFFDENLKCFFLEDFGSANGTHLDNIRVDGKEQLSHLNVISIAGLYDFIFQDIQACKARHPDREQTESPVKRQPQTVVQKGAFVTPPKFGKEKKESIGDHPKTVLGKGPLSLPPNLVKPQGKSSSDSSGTVVGEGAFVLPPQLEKKEETSIGDHSETVIEEKPSSLPPHLGKPQKQSISDSPGTVVGDGIFVLPPEFEKVKEDGAETVFPGGGSKTGPFNKTDRLLPQKPSPSKKRFFLEVWINETRTRRFALKEGENIIGRKAPADIIIEKIELSRRHAVLTLKNGSVHLRDSNSKNKTFVDGKEVIETLEIQPNHALRFGLIKAKLLSE